MTFPSRYVKAKNDTNKIWTRKPKIERVGKLNFKLMKRLLKFAIVAIIVTGCSNEETNNSEESYKISALRANLIENKTISEIKTDYATTLTSDKVAIWQDKLEQLKSLDIPSENIKLIDNLSKELQNYNTSKEIGKINAIAEKLANITPVKDYIKMFASLENYQFTGKFEGDIMAIEYFNTFKIKNTFEISSISSTSKTPDCNCRWTCDEHNSGVSNTDCIETSIGCGFLWLGSCIERY